jgi:uncharacterized protein
VTLTGPVTIRGRLEQQVKGLGFDAELDSTLRMECVRCLEPFETKQVTPIRLKFVPQLERAAGSEIQLHQEDCELWPAPAGRVDLIELAAEQLALAIPVKPLCREACAGLCATCGTNLNEARCDCTADGRQSLEPWKQSLLSHGRT